MSTIKDLEIHLQTLQASLSQLKASGETLQGWVDSCGGGKYQRHRWWRGAGVTPGSRKLFPQEVGEVKAAIERGRQVSTLEQQIATLTQELAKKRQIARELGLL
jgi:hypothetical protein